MEKNRTIYQSGVGNVVKSIESICKNIANFRKRLPTDTTGKLFKDSISMRRLSLTSLANAKKELINKSFTAYPMTDLEIQVVPLEDVLRIFTKLGVKDLTLVTKLNGQVRVLSHQPENTTNEQQCESSSSKESTE